MACKPSNERSSPRSLLFCPISVTFPEGKAHGILRDISSGGIFFYSSLKPALRTSVNFVLHLKDKKLKGKGEVVRVEQSAPGAAIGVAVKISGYDEC